MNVLTIYPPLNWAPLSCPVDIICAWKVVFYFLVPSNATLKSCHGNSMDKYFEGQILFPAPSSNVSFFPIIYPCSTTHKHFICLQPQSNIYFVFCCFI